MYLCLSRSPRLASTHRYYPHIYTGTPTWLLVLALLPFKSGLNPTTHHPPPRKCIAQQLPSLRFHSFPFDSIRSDPFGLYGSLCFWCPFNSRKLVLTLGISIGCVIWLAGGLWLAENWWESNRFWLRQSDRLLILWGLWLFQVPKGISIQGK